MLSFDDALAAAKKEGLDLILIVPNANPPVARITNFDKFRYEKEKEEKKQRQAKKTLEMKQIQISVREAKHDLERKVKLLEKFLEAGHKIEVLLALRGREKKMKDWARTKLEEFLEMITVSHTITQEIRSAGRGFTVQLIKK